MSALTREQLLKRLLAERFNGYWWRRRMIASRLPHRKLLEISMEE